MKTAAGQIILIVLLIMGIVALGLDYKLSGLCLFILKVTIFWFIGMVFKILYTFFILKIFRKKNGNGKTTGDHE